LIKLGFSITFLIFNLVLALFPIYTYSETEISAITIPSADVTLSFIQPGRIAELNAGEGDMVSVNQLILRLDDLAEQAQLAQIKAQAEDTTQIDAASASLSQKKIDLELLEWAAARSSATELEVKHAKLDVELAELSLKAAQFEHEQNKRKYDEAKVRIDRMSLRSPVSGRIEKVEFDVGESVNALDKVVRVVRTNPLWIDVPVPLTDGKKLADKQTAEVKYPDSNKTIKGKIIFISTAADAASSTMRVRVEVPNPSGRPSGEYVSIIFPQVKKTQTVSPVSPVSPISNDKPKKH